LRALIIVDMQNDFMPNGPLGVSGANVLIPVINQLIPQFPLVIASQDWHPANHVSFADNHPGKKIGDIIEVAGYSQVLWPVHCVQNTVGAEIVPGLATKGIQAYFHKGTDPKVDSYSAFFDNARQRSTGLEDYLRSHKVTETYFVGVATDYCVLYSVFDAVDLGFSATMVLDACAGIDLNKGDVEKSLLAISAIGGKIIQSDALFRDDCFRV